MILLLRILLCPCSDMFQFFAIFVTYFADLCNMKISSREFVAYLAKFLYSLNFNLIFLSMHLLGLKIA